jgi:anti-sigma factor RsiW
MDCERCLEQLDAYLDGELDAPDASLLAAHLRQCPSCQAEYRAREWENRLYRDVAAGASLPEGLWPRIAAGMAAVDEREQRRSSGGRTDWFRPEWSGWWRLGPALGCLLALAASVRHAGAASGSGADSAQPVGYRRLATHLAARKPFTVGFGNAGAGGYCHH